MYYLSIICFFCFLAKKKSHEMLMFSFLSGPVPSMCSQLRSGLSLAQPLSVSWSHISGCLLPMLLGVLSQLWMIFHVCFSRFLPSLIKGPPPHPVTQPP